ncbi:MAG: hypothetical protein VW396_02095, partial [Ilumatobacter sp.]
HEGPTDDAAITALRDRQRRNMMATLLLSQGVPMILGGDEIGRTQGGNNNAYCQDNETSWFDWSDIDRTFLEWCRRLIALREAHPVFRRRRWFKGQRIRGVDDMAWFRPDGDEMGESDWEQGFAQSVAVFMNGSTLRAPDRYGEPVFDDSFLVVLSASDTDIDWTLPAEGWGNRWIVTLDSAEPDVDEENDRVLSAGATLRVPSRSLLVLRSLDPQRR